MKALLVAIISLAAAASLRAQGIIVCEGDLFDESFDYTIAPQFIGLQSATLPGDVASSALIPPVQQQSPLAIQPVPEPSVIALGGAAVGTIAFAQGYRRHRSRLRSASRAR